MEIRVLAASLVHSRGLDDFIASRMIYGKSMIQFWRTGANRANRWKRYNRCDPSPFSKLVRHQPVFRLAAGFVDLVFLAAFVGFSAGVR